ncbi:hypothetical protein WMF27_07255 [Sorangium sp. So ce281]|uniref:hypothetical protein n=1 Tax=unclassified Sorangium TaxID=2621164 RepID=UPI003F627C43
MRNPGSGSVESGMLAAAIARPAWRRLRGLALSCAACLSLALTACAAPAPGARGPLAPRPAARPATHGAPTAPATALPADDATDLAREALAPFFAAPRASAADDQDTWLTPRVSVEKLPAECWELAPEQDAAGLAMVALHRRERGPVQCAPFSARLAPFATFAVDRRAGTVRWWDEATPRPMREFFAAREEFLRAAVSALEKRFIDDAIAWGGTTALRVEGETAMHLHVSVLSPDGRKRLARFRVDRRTRELSWDDNGELRGYEAFKASWYRDHHPAVTALGQLLEWKWSGVDSLTLEASHGHAFDLVARAGGTCSPASRICATERFRVDMRRGAVMWHDGKAYVPIERFLQDLERKGQRAVLLARAWALKQRGPAGASCIAFRAESVDRASAHVRMHLAPPCNTSPMLMTLAWYFVDLRTGKVCSSEDDTCGSKSGQGRP